MKLRLDESVPRQLGRCFPETFEVRSVQQMGWAGRKNGDVIKRAATHGFDAFITADQGASTNKTRTLCRPLSSC